MDRWLGAADKDLGTSGSRAELVTPPIRPNSGLIFSACSWLKFCARPGGVSTLQRTHFNLFHISC